MLPSMECCFSVCYHGVGEPGRGARLRSRKRSAATSAASPGGFLYCPTCRGRSGLSGLSGLSVISPPVYQVLTIVRG